MGALARNDLIGDRYRVVRWIGEGACAVVYEAVDTHEQDRRVAVKVMSEHLMGNATFQRRFVQEAEAAIHIDSPFVVSVQAVKVQDDGCPYIVMELLDGEDLGHLLDRVGSLEEHHAVELTIHALSGLAHAHARGVLHRDIKPANLFIVRSASGDELLKIVDLGIAKLVTGAPEAQGLTRTNSVLGSPVYMSPEQCRGAKNMDHRSDVYSVGVVLYECLTAKLPHGGENLNELMFKIALEDAPDPTIHKPTLDPALAAIVMKALARDIDKRFASASAFREALLEWGAERGARVPPAPSSGRMPARPVSSRRRLEVTLDEEDGLEAQAREVEPRPKPKNDATLVGAATPVVPRLADSLEPSRSKSKMTTVLLLAAAISVVIIVLVLRSGSSPPVSASTAVSATGASPASASGAPSSSSLPEARVAAPSTPTPALFAAASAKATPKTSKKVAPRKKSGVVAGSDAGGAPAAEATIEWEEPDPSSPTED